MNTLGEGILRDPQGLCVTRDGLVVVSDQCNVYIVHPSGQILHTISGFSFAYGVTEDSEGNILVVDCFKHQILKYSRDGQLIKKVGREDKKEGSESLEEEGSESLEEGGESLEFSYPTGITRNHINGRFYVTEFNKDRVQVLNSDLTFHSSFGEHGTGLGQFDRPSAIACDRWGNIYVVDYGNQRIRVFTADGVSIRKWEQCTVVLLRPDGIVVNNRGEVYIGEARRNCITKLDSEGRFMESFKASGRESYLKEPSGLALIDGMLLFCDNGRPKCIRCLPGVC